MFRNRVPWLVFAFAAGLCLAGLPNWIAPYNSGGLIDPLMIAGLAGLSAMAMMLVVGGLAQPLLAWAMMASCLPLAVVARVVVERAGDPASHDLWLVEIAVATVAGAVAALPGALAGHLTRRLQDPRRGR
ncbi:MAG: hypothetical protein KF780_02290 [Sphingomonas sp.]|nr:hypothetical protein [Sphingomonas sp.]